jgi:transposase InsO family protein
MVTDLCGFQFSDEQWAKEYGRQCRDKQMIQKFTHLGDYNYKGLKLVHHDVEAVNEAPELDDMDEDGLYGQAGTPAATGVNDEPCEVAVLDVAKVEGSLEGLVSLDGLGGLASPLPAVDITTAKGRLDAGISSLALRDFGSGEVPIFIPTVQELPEKQDRQAKLRAELVREYERYAESYPDKRSTVMSRFVEMYNEGLMVPELYKNQGTISERTLYRWRKDYLEAKLDYRVLADVRGPAKASLAAKEDVDWCLALLFSDRQVSIGSVINKWAWEQYKKQGKALPVSERTLERAIKRWISAHKCEWELRLKGEKYFIEHRLPTILMDYSTLKVGDQCQTDGKLLNVMVRNPFTGKAVRPHLCGFMDTASRMFTGFSLDWTENSRMIQEAYMNHLLFAGYVPISIKQDNGSGFVSKETLGEKDIAELQGIYYRSGVKRVQMHRAYNAKGKALIERGFGTLCSQFERYLASFTGTSVSGKPASSHRNEKWLQKLEKREALEVSEFKAALEDYIMGQYAHMPKVSLNGRTPWEVFSEGRKQISAERFVRAEDYVYLLRCETKKVSNNGITIKGQRYYHPELINYVKETVKVRYGLLEDRFILVYSLSEEFICQATARLYTHPTAVDAGELEQGIVRHHNRLIRHTLSRYKKAVTGLRQIIGEHPALAGGKRDELIMSNKLIQVVQEQGARDKQELAEDVIMAELEQGEETVKNERNDMEPMDDMDTMDGELESSVEAEANLNELLRNTLG